MKKMDLRLCALLLALLLLAAALYGLEYTIPGLNLLSELKMLACLAISLLVAGVVISTLSTLVVVNKFVNMRSNKIYIY
jgi:cell division transport system permease protein